MNREQADEIDGDLNIFFDAAKVKSREFDIIVYLSLRIYR